MARLVTGRGRYTLREQLLLWVTLPMLVLILLDTTILYKVGIHFVNQSFDDSLVDIANDIVAMMNESGKRPQAFRMSSETESVLFSNQFDQTYYSIFNLAGSRLSGNYPLPFVSDGRTNKHFQSRLIDHQQMRLLTVRSQVLDSMRQPQPYIIVIAETLNKRTDLRNRILLAIILPQLLLMLVCVLMLYWGIRQGLTPLSELNEEIAKRSSTQLDPVTLKSVPEEATLLINSINLLMGRLRNAIVSQNQFIADAAHQLRTPLAGIQAQVELALKQEDSQRPLMMISDSVAKLTHLLNQLLRLSRNQPEAANVIEYQPVNLLKIAQDTCVEIFHLALKKDIDLGFESSTDQPLASFDLYGDKQRLKVMILNILDNAIRYTPIGGRVTLSLQAVQQEMILKVEDNGMGIPEAERELVFERFHRVLENSQEGSGLGLSIVKEIAILHGANVYIESPTHGPGTVLVVHFRKQS